jgi:hypothetical protein
VGSEKYNSYTVTAAHRDRVNFVNTDNIQSWHAGFVRFRIIRLSVRSASAGHELWKRRPLRSPRLARRSEHRMFLTMKRTMSIQIGSHHQSGGGSSPCPCWQLLPRPCRSSRRDSVSRWLRREPGWLSRVTRSDSVENSWVASVGDYAILHSRPILFCRLPFYLAVGSHFTSRFSCGAGVGGAVLWGRVGC